MAVILDGVRINVTIDAQLTWPTPSDGGHEKFRRMEQANVVRGLGHNLEQPIREILEQMLAQRMMIDGGN